MVHLKLVCCLALVLSLAYVHGEIRVARSPQFGGYSQAEAHAQSGGFGGQYFGPRPPYFGPRPPFFGPRPHFYDPRPPIFGPRPPYFGNGFGRPQGSISISKSISINSGGGGGASSNAEAGGLGK